MHDAPTTALELPPEPLVRNRGLEHIAADLEATRQHLFRVLAGFNALQMAYLTWRKELPPNERARGMPIFSFHATATGHDRQTIELDLAGLDPVELEQVLVPLIRLSFVQCEAAARAIEAYAAELTAYLKQMRGEEGQ